jgi:dihydroflavonol-4-reductase
MGVQAGAIIDTLETHQKSLGRPVGGDRRAIMESHSQASGQGPILVTGASGFLGSAIAKALREEGRRVRVLVRASSSRVNVDAADEVAVGDLLDRASVARALAGVCQVIHTAADYRLWAPPGEDIVRNNVESTRIIMEEAQRAGIERIVYTSSVATIDLRSGGVVNEQNTLPADAAIGAYKRSKVLAENLVSDMASRDGLPVVIVNPSTPIGPRDVKPTPTGRIIVEAASGRVPAFVDTGLNFAHVDDVAAGHLAALRQGRIGERYILGGENISLRDMLSEIATVVGGRPPRVRLPRSAVYPIAFGAELYARISKREPFVTLDGLRMSRYRMFFDDSKARRELGYTSRPYRQGLIDAIDWFVQAGYLRR